MKMKHLTAVFAAALAFSLPQSLWSYRTVTHRDMLQAAVNGLCPAAGDPFCDELTTYLPLLKYGATMEDDFEEGADDAG